MDLEGILNQLPLFQEVRSTQAELQKRVFALAKAAFYDELTQLPNKAALLATAKAYDLDKGNLAVIFVDLSGFKELNDHYGHDAGDVALGKVGLDLSKVAKAHDALAYRYGGDEFVIIARAEIVEDVLSHASRLLNQLTFQLGGQELKVQATLGYATPDGPLLLNQLIDRADQACRAGKEKADNQAIVWTKDLALDEVETLRRKCPHCLATSSLQVFLSKKQSNALQACSNCGQEFPPRLESAPS